MSRKLILIFCSIFATIVLFGFIVAKNTNNSNPKKQLENWMDVSSVCKNMDYEKNIEGCLDEITTEHGNEEVRLKICIANEDELDSELFEDFIWGSTKYIIQIMEVDLEEISQCSNLLVTEKLIVEDKKARMHLKKAIANNAKLVIVTDKTPFVILSLLDINIGEVSPTNIYPKCSDIGAVGIYREDSNYVVGYAKLNLVARYSRDYYNTLLRGFL